MKTYVAIVRDHSASMYYLTGAATRDYNETVAAIKRASEGEDTIITTIKCGVGRQHPAKVVRETVNSSVFVLKELKPNEYVADGSSTPLFDSIGEAIDIFKSVPDYNDPEVAFLVQVVTDGEENSSTKWSAARFREEIKRLQATDRWSFVFRVPKGYARTLTSLGIPPGNIFEWDQTERGLRTSTQATESAFQNFYQARKSGNVRSTTGFYTDLADLKPEDVKSKLVSINHQVQIWPVNQTIDIKTFVEGYVGYGRFVSGASFYQLTKREKAVQDYKEILVRDRKTGLVYAGARGILGFPDYGTIAVSPGDHGQWDIFIQSTSNNRKLIAGTQLIYWPDVIMRRR